MTSREAAKLIDAPATMAVEMTSGTLYVPVTILDIRQSFGRHDALVTSQNGHTRPVEGLWVSMDRLEITTA